MTRESLIIELQRLKLYGYFVPEEAFQLAIEIDLTSVKDMQLNAAAIYITQLASKNMKAKKSNLT